MWNFSPIHQRSRSKAYEVRRHLRIVGCCSRGQLCEFLGRSEPGVHTVSTVALVRPAGSIRTLLR